MYSIVLAWLAAALFAGNASDCSGELRAIAPDVDEIPGEPFVADRPGTAAQLEARMLDDHRLMVTSHDSDLPDLKLSGSAATFPWHSVNDTSMIVLEQCDLAESSLSLSAGSQYLDWVGPGFFNHRPDTGVQAESLRSFAFSSEALGQDREVYLVVPDGWDGASGDPLLLSGDALAGSTFGAIVEALAADGQSRPIAFASARFGDGMLPEADVALRSAEYHRLSESATDAKMVAYTNHETFFFQEFLPSVVEQLGAETGPIFLFGISSSASFALEQGLKRSDTIAGVIAASPPIHASTIAMLDETTTSQTIRLWCGTLEDLFCSRTRALAESHDLQLNTLQATHDSALWEEALSASIVELFPPKSNATPPDP